MPADFGFFDGVPAHEARMAREGVGELWDMVRRPHTIPKVVARSIMQTKEYLRGEDIPHVSIVDVAWGEGRIIR